MPHKRNPILAERISGLARLFRGYVTAALENVALWHERDISHSSVERVILPDSTIALYYMLEKMCFMLENMRVYPERMKENLEKSRGLIYSQAILLHLVERGLSREKAYAIVQRNAFVARERKVNFVQALLDDPEVTQYLSPDEIQHICQIDHHLKNIDFIFQRLGLDEKKLEGKSGN